MGRPGYSRRHYDLLSNGGPDTPEAIAERRYYNEVVTPTLNRERAERFPRVTAANVREMLDWQERRIAELRERRGK